MASALDTVIARYNEAIAPLGQTLVTAGTSASARQLLGPVVFDARDYGVIADGLPHNNVANLLDCFAAAYAAGAQEVLWPAGVIDTSDAVIGTVKANSGNSYTNNGGIPLPTGNQGVTISGHGKSVTTLKLSAGFTRAFDFWWNATEQFYKNITLRNFTVDRNNLLGINIAPSMAVTSGVTLTLTTWVTLPGISASSFRNVQYVYFASTNTGTAAARKMQARVSGGNVQVFNNTSGSLTLVTGDLVQGSIQGHVICGTKTGLYGSGINMYVDRVLLENIDAINIADSTATATTITAPNQSLGVAMEVYLNASASPSAVPCVTNFTARNVRIEGGSFGIEVIGANAGTFVDEVWFENCFHDTMIAPSTNWNSANFFIGYQAWVNRAGVTRCVGRRSGDVSLEVDQPWEFYESDCKWEEGYNGNYCTTFVPPAKTSAGPPTTTLGADVTSGASSATFTLPASVDRTGTILIDSELLFYKVSSAGAVTIYRGINGSTAAAHTSGAVITFVETVKTRVTSTRAHFNNQAVLALGTGAGRGYISYTNNNLPLPPLRIRDATATFVGGNLITGQFIYWQGWRQDLDIQGVEFNQSGLANSSSAIGSLIACDWANGYAMRPGLVQCPAPRIYGRNNVFRSSGVVNSASVFHVLHTLRGYAQTDFDLTAQVVMTGSGPGVGMEIVSLVGSGGVMLLAPGSRLGIRAGSDTVSTSSDAAPRTLVVGPTSGLSIPTVLDVDIDATEMSFFGTAGDTGYAPWIIDSTQVGKIRFGKIAHSSGATGQYPAVKQMATVVTGNYTVTTTDQVLLVNSSGGALTITLPPSASGSSSAGEPLSRGRELVIVDVGLASASNPITITPASTDKINKGTAGTSTTLNVNGATRRFTAYAALPGWIASAIDPAVRGFTTTVTAATTTTLNVDSTEVQEFTGSTTQTVLLPTTGIAAGQSYRIINNSTGAITLQASGGQTVLAFSSGVSVRVTALVATPTLAAHWAVMSGVNNNITSGAAGNTLALRASTGNLFANAFAPGFTTTATAGTTTTLTSSSTEMQVFTGSSNQTVTLPTTSIAAGQRITVMNLSTGVVTVQSSGANTVLSLNTNYSATFVALVATPTTAANWSYIFSPSVTADPAAATSNTLVQRTGLGNIVGNALIPNFRTQATAAGTTTLVAADGQVQVFTGSTTQTVVLPSTSIVVAREFKIINNSSSGALTINASGGGLVKTLAQGASTVITALIATPTAATDWYATA